MSDVALHSELELLLSEKRLFPHFQPLVDLATGDIYGYEALIRGPVDSPLAMPDKLFSVARAAGRLQELELLCRRLSIESYVSLNLGARLFLNVSAELLMDPEYPSGLTLALINQLGLAPERIVMELSEQHPFEDYALARQVVNHYRNMGFRIAIDDIGSGYSGLRLWLEMAPDYVKLDKHFVHGIDTQPVKREFVKAMVAIAQGVNATLVAEGIETLDELRSIQSMGIGVGQGFLMGRPHPKPHLLLSQERIVGESYTPRTMASRSSDSAASVQTTVDPILPDTILGSVASYFQEHPQISALPVVQQGKPVGLVKRTVLMETFSTQYGRALYENKPVKRFMDSTPLIVEASLPLEKVSQALTEAVKVDIGDSFIITEKGYYSGLGSVRDVLRKMTDLQVQHARYANPLTQLPGNVVISQEVENLLRTGTDFRIAYCDLNNFKPFNDHYGFARGDEVIRFVGDLLVRFCQGRDTLVGHIGGDDFIVIFRDNGWQSTLQKALDHFARDIENFYDSQDLMAGGIPGVDREGQQRFFSTLSLAIAVVHPDPMVCASYKDVGELAAVAKHEAKEKGSNCLIESRVHLPPHYQLRA
ncbi:GGDEF domain-containing protein [Pokkaliibacter sp. CJK22405]|uniref:GGDEF domain-containing protein n=1 Tax=Pokkaliibacter sp. CJK22405 TaxID=3384615 RepID=UPI003984B2EC